MGYNHPLVRLRAVVNERGLVHGETVALHKHSLSQVLDRLNPLLEPDGVLTGALTSRLTFLAGGKWSCLRINKPAPPPSTGHMDVGGAVPANTPGDLAGCPSHLVARVRAGER